MNIYVHIPFCRRKCLYCDFYSVGERLADWSRMVDALLAEARMRVPESVPGDYPSTLYIGGGTPSLIPGEEFTRLAQGLLSLAGEVREFTIEVNPDDVTPEKAAVWRAAGVNRVSMGVQSLVDAELKAISRRHTAEEARRAAAILRDNFGNVSLDVMFGLPGQTLSSFETTVSGVTGLRPDHVSAYSLMYEERTALTRMRDSGTIEEADENLSVEMYMMLRDMLGAAGYEQYELSNYATPGHRSLHNSLYWLGLPYTGLGPAAHSYDGIRTRRANLPDFRRYLRNPAAAFEEEVLSDDELREEMIMTRLRTREGLSLDEYGSRFGEASLRALLHHAGKHLSSGRLRMVAYRLALTPSGVMLADDIISSLF